MTAPQAYPEFVGRGESLTTHVEKQIINVPTELDPFNARAAFYCLCLIVSVFTMVLLCIRVCRRAAAAAPPSQVKKTD